MSTRRKRPDLIYFDWIHSFVVGRTLLWSLIKSSFFLAELEYLRFRKTPLFHTIHNLQNHPGLWLPLEKFVYQIFLKRCTRIRVYSDETKKEAVEKFEINPEKIIVAPDPPYHLYYPNEVSKKESRAFLKIVGEPILFLFFGLIKPYKGLEQLIQTFQKIPVGRHQLVIAGQCDNPAYLETLQRLSAFTPQIIWHHKFVSKEEVQYYFNAADVVVLPFKRIDHSGTVDLAMCFAKPIITLNTPAIARLLRHQKHLLFDNPDALYERLTGVLPAELTEIGKANYEITQRQNLNHFLQLFYGHHPVTEQETVL